MTRSAPLFRAGRATLTWAPYGFAEVAPVAPNRFTATVPPQLETPRAALDDTGKVSDSPPVDPRPTQRPRTAQRRPGDPGGSLPHPKLLAPRRGARPDAGRGRAARRRQPRRAPSRCRGKLSGLALRHRGREEQHHARDVHLRRRSRR